MADITTVPFLRHLRSGSTSWVRHTRSGTIVHEGNGQSFWFRPLSAILSEVPVDDRELPMLFHARTLDFQDVTVQAAITFRVVQPALAAERLDFGLDDATGRWRSDPLGQLGALLTQSAQQHALEVLAGLTLVEALTRGYAEVRAAVTQGVRADGRVGATGLEVVEVRVVAVRPEPDVERALQTPTREQVQQDADKATYERRALAVERERTIAENEMQSQIELARREQELVGQRGTNARRKAEEEAASAEIEARAQAARDEMLSTSQASRIREVGEAEAGAEAARVQVYATLPEGVLTGLAFRELATNLPAIQSLVLTPDLISPILARLGRPEEG
ncbi:SPFH domain-containing protein [Pedococcus sp. P5_B7]